MLPPKSDRKKRLRKTLFSHVFQRHTPVFSRRAGRTLCFWNLFFLPPEKLPLRRHNIHYNQLRAIKYPWQLISAKPPADNHCRMSPQRISSSCIFRKPSLIGCIQTIYYPRNPDLSSMRMPGNDQVKPTVNLLSNAIKINRHSTTAIQNRFPPAGYECLLLNNVLIPGIRLMNLFTAAILNKFPSKIFTFLFIRAASAALLSIFHDKWILMVFWVFPQTSRTVRYADLAKSILWSKKTQARTW